MSNRTIRIIGSIDEDSYRQFCEEMDVLESEKDPYVAGSDVIYVDITSAGGVAYDALAFVARIRQSTCKVITTCYGSAFSAASLILAAGTKRRITRESWVMVHEDTKKLKSEVKDLERDVEHLRRLETQWTYLLESMSTTGQKKWTELHKKTTYLDANECLAMGLVDEII